MKLSQEQKEFLHQATRDKDNFRNLEEYQTIYEERDKNNRLVGLCGTTPRHGIFKTVFLCVAQKEQGKGIGTRLFEKMLQSEKKKPWLTVYKDNIPALKIYRKHYFLLPYRKGIYLGIPK